MPHSEDAPHRRYSASESQTAVGWWLVAALMGRRSVLCVRQALSVFSTRNPIYLSEPAFEPGSMPVLTATGSWLFDFQPSRMLAVWRHDVFKTRM